MAERQEEGGQPGSPRAPSQLHPMRRCSSYAWAPHCLPGSYRESTFFPELLITTDPDLRDCPCDVSRPSWGCAFKIQSQETHLLTKTLCPGLWVASDRSSCCSSSLSGGLGPQRPAQMSQVAPWGLWLGSAAGLPFCAGF